MTQLILEWSDNVLVIPKEWHEAIYLPQDEKLPGPSFMKVFKEWGDGHTKEQE